MKNVLQENMRRFATKNLNEQAQFGGMQSPVKKKAVAGTYINNLELNNARVSHSGMYVEVKFNASDIIGNPLKENGTCTILLFMKNGNIGYSNAYCVTPDGRDFPQMQNVVEKLIDLEKTKIADSVYFSKDILTKFKAKQK